MRRWAGRIAGAIGMGVAWALAWGVIGVLVSLVVDPDGSMDEMWVAVGAYPGFVAGLIFYAVLAAVGRVRRHGLSLSRAGVLGAAAGLLPGLFPLAVVAALTARTQLPVWPLAASTLAGTTVMSVVLAVGSVWLSRAVAGRGNGERLHAGPAGP